LTVQVDRARTRAKRLTALPFRKQANLLSQVQNPTDPRHSESSRSGPPILLGFDVNICHQAPEDGLRQERRGVVGSRADSSLNTWVGTL
jgi:hypothetical protein